MVQLSLQKEYCGSLNEPKGWLVPHRRPSGCSFPHALLQRQMMGWQVQTENSDLTDYCLTEASRT